MIADRAVLDAVKEFLAGFAVTAHQADGDFQACAFGLLR